MQNKLSRVLYYISFIVGIALVLLIFAQVFSVSKYNNTPHIIKSTDIDDKMSVVITPRTGDSARWPKSNLGVEGGIFDATFHNGTTDIVYQQELSKIGIKFSVGYNRWDAMKTIYDNIILNINETNAILYKDVIKECSEDLLRIEECFGSRAILPMAVKQIITSAQ